MNRVRPSRALAALVLGLPLAASCSADRTAPTERTVDLGSHALHAVVAGRGSPAVVIDGGIGASCGEYRDLQARIAAATTVVTYDRAGYGASGIGPLPRDSGREAQELRELLAGLDVRPPFILVGHSLGGLNAQVYADLFPQDVAGMVLLDPPPLGFLLGEDHAELAALAGRMTGEWQNAADAGLRADDERARAEAGFFLMLASEHREMFGGSARRAAAIDTFGAIPLVVVASGVPNPMFGEHAGPYQAYWADRSEALAARSSRGRYVFAAASTHRLHVDAADLVVDRILALVRASRDGAASSGRSGSPGRGG